MAKTLNKKQRLAIELLTSGKGMSYKQIAEEVGVNIKTLWDWRNEPQYTLFQEEMKKINDARWEAAVDAAREAAVKLCKDGNQKMVQFILQNEGYNPTQSINANITSKEYVITIDEE